MAVVNINNRKKIHSLENTFTSYEITYVTDNDGTHKPQWLLGGKLLANIKQVILRKRLATICPQDLPKRKFIIISEKDWI